MPVPSKLLVDSIGGSKPAQAELGRYLDSLMPLFGAGATKVTKVVGTLPSGAVNAIAGNGLTGGGTTAADFTFNVGAGAGIAVDPDAVRVLLAGSSGLALPGAALAVDQTYPFAWSGVQTHAAGSAFAGGIDSSLIPNLTDTYDLGSSSKMWRKGWLSELDAVLFAKNTITLLGGWFIVGKNEGVLAVASGTGTTVDFGIAMTLNQFVLFRGALQVEYMKVGTLVSGTTYNVTRDLDGTGANNWVAGSVFLVLGISGDGRIELNASSTPRISVLRQGATYNAQTEMARLGDMNGAYGVASELYGFGVGDYAGGNYLEYDTSGGFKLVAGAGAISIDASGISIGGTGQLVNFYKTAAFSTNLGYITIFSTAGIGAGMLHHSSGDAANAVTDGYYILESASANAAQIARIMAIGSSQSGYGQVNIYNLAGTFKGLRVGDNGTPAAMVDVAGSGIFSGGLNVGTATGAGTGVYKSTGTGNLLMDVVCDGLGAGSQITGYRNAGPNQSGFTGRSARGSLASPTSSAASDIVMRYAGAGYHSQGTPGFSQTGEMRITATEAHTDVAQGTKLEFYTVTAAGITQTLALTLTGATAVVAGAFGCNTKGAQTAFASGGAAPAGGTGTAAGGYDTAAHRDTLITLVNNIRTALVNNGIMS